MVLDASVDELIQLADLIRERNELERKISAIVGRPAALSHLGEYIAARIFSIRLVKSAAHPSIDGYFFEGALAPCSVNIKWYAMRDGSLDIAPGFLPDYYLVLTGPPPSATAALGLRSRPWKISSVHLFDAAELVDDLDGRNIRIGNASSVRKDLWELAEIYPRSICKRYPLSAEQITLLALFS